MTRLQQRVARRARAEAQLARPFERVLVALDFSPRSNRALSRAMRLPLAPRARLELLHVLPRALPAPLDGEGEALARERMLRAAGRRRDVFPGLDQITVRAEVVRGDSAAAILEHASQVDADLIVLGRSGLLTGDGDGIGTTARAVARRASRPILIVRSRGARPYRRPLVALGLEDGSREALRLAARLAGTPRRIRAAHASGAPGEGLTRRAALPLGTARHRRTLEGVRRELSRHLRSLEGIPERIRLTIGRGSPPALVLGLARARGADLIALGVHGRRSSLQRLLHGSVTEEVLREAPCDVLIARPA